MCEFESVQHSNGTLELQVKVDQSVCMIVMHLSCWNMPRVLLHTYDASFWTFHLLVRRKLQWHCSDSCQDSVKIAAIIPHIAQLCMQPTKVSVRLTQAQFKNVKPICHNSRLFSRKYSFFTRFPPCVSHTQNYGSQHGAVLIHCKLLLLARRRAP